MKQHLLSKIHSHTAPIAIIGLGYVGLPLRQCSGQALAVAFAQAASVFPASDRQ